MIMLAAIFSPLTSAISATPVQILAYETQEGVSSQALNARHGFFNQLATDCYNVNREGQIRGSVPKGDIDFAQSHEMTVFATVSNFSGNDFSGELVDAIIRSPKATQAFLEGAQKLLAAGHYAGLNIDFESISNQDRSTFTAFIATVSDTMRKAGYLTIVSVPAAGKDDPSNSWTGAFDLKSLGAHADLLQVMTYDENGPWGGAGPIAGLDWVEAAIRYTASVVPPNKISLGIPAFAYDWDLDDSHQDKQINWTDVEPLIEKVHGEAHWDSSSSSPNFTYTREGHRHIVWHENAKSLGLKTRLVATYKLAGVSVWALGQENDAFWQALRLPL